MEGKEVIVISSSPGKDRMLSNIRCKQEDDDDGSTLLRKDMDMMDDCIILDFNPFDSMDIAKLSITIQDVHDDDDDDDDDDLTVVAEKGKVACRDYPHSRHLCVRFPFDKTPHEKHCYLCYCYVCDSVAPCEFWTKHCHASEHVEDWKFRRELRLKIRPQIL